MTDDEIVPPAVPRVMNDDEPPQTREQFLRSLENIGDYSPTGQSEGDGKVRTSASHVERVSKVIRDTTQDNPGRTR